MKKLALGLVAVAALFAAATPTMAQGFGFPILGPYYPNSPYYGYYNYAPRPDYYVVPSYGYYDYNYPRDWGWNGYRWNYDNW
jgi:hypothetical protein